MPDLIVTRLRDNVTKITSLLQYPITLLLIAFSLTGIRSHQRSMRDLVAERDARLVQALADDVAALLARYSTGLQILAASEPLKAGDAPTAKTALSEASQRLDGISPLIVDSEGQITLGPPLPPTWTDAAIRCLLTTASNPDASEAAVLADGHTLFWGIPLNQGLGWLVGGLSLERLPLDRILNTGHLRRTATITWSPTRPSSAATGH